MSARIHPTLGNPTVQQPTNHPLIKILKISPLNFTSRTVRDLFRLRTVDGAYL
jgi:hypothetical protein